ncbi:DUF551 domain-containing protein, partial [Enterobacter kobei]|uniref:DUF551 domain-containing protein n=1 Tax=Enterobacter kobei TaxID=208224 RepID=UPI001BDF9013
LSGLPTGLVNFCRGTWLYLPDQCQYGVRLTLTKQMLGTIAEFTFRAGRESATQAGNSPVIPDGWVACSERMPEQFKAILVFNEYGEVWSGAYDRYWNFYCDNELVECVTHWMPLPAAPQQEA